MSQMCHKDLRDKRGLSHLRLRRLLTTSPTVSKRPRLWLMESATMSNLSLLQQFILVWLITRVRFAEHDRQLLERGIDWMPEWTPKTTNQTEDKRLENVWRALLCRSLARLQQRESG